ncbi:MAG TPA: MarR family winged helix-turn-helix transcriptional regulator [Paraburkholderia sp.]|uniref:MarR family winged helix-turn-helix transcriptional regulator n=1 Tax=Paraburkholderia sp. TaxID=1926495 RepID=UPI002B4860A4|nr:MarR family winged helix-turn-helix transcriptional regulator [Paraburkholderia sp.]HKR44873.1 MarR family winged helix-turn-helix transcriptional regulator [Paraburkholderia sp.]
MTNLHVLRLAVSSTLVVAARKWRSTSQGLLTAYNISEACAAPLLIAARLGEPVHQVTLAGHTGIEGPALVRLLDQLCDAGLVRRDEDPDDHRAKAISLTDQGRIVTAKIEADLRDLRARLLKDVSRADLEATLRVLNAFNTPDPVGLHPGPETESAP